MSLFGFLGKVATGFLAGGPAGAIAGAAAHVLAPKAPAPPRVTTTRPGGAIGVITGRVTSQPYTVGQGMVNTGGMPLLAPPRGPGLPPPLPQIDSTRTSGVSLFPGGPMVGTQTTYTSAPSQAGAGCSKGFHLNKTGYYTRQGYVAPGSRCVKNRRRNPLNPRALSRSISRISSAKNASKFLSRVTVRERGCGCK